MKHTKTAGRLLLAAGLAATSLAAATPAVGADRGNPVRVITSGLDGPYGLAAFRKGWVVAENNTGEVTYVNRKGAQRALLSGAGGVAGVAGGKSRVFSVLGGPNEEGTPPPSAYPASSVLRTNVKRHTTTVIADLLQYELVHNPDGQAQFSPDHTPYDALSNPFAMTKYKRGLLVADGGANDVLLVNPRTGHVKTFFVPPTVKGSEVAACGAPDAQANPGTQGCDPVPTGVTFARGSVWVSTLGAETPGAGKVYKLNARTGAVQRVWSGLDSPTGVAVGRNGNIFVSQVDEGAPQGEPGPGFDPSTVGQITRIARDGSVKRAQVTMPTGLLFKKGKLYSSAWSIAAFLGMEHAGQIVQVKPKAFQ